MSTQWDFYLTTLGQWPASIFADLGLKNEAPDPARPVLLSMRLEFCQPRADGLSSDAEFPVLAAIEESMLAAATARSDARYVGRITTAGRRDFFFYGISPVGFDHAMTVGMRDFPAYEYAVSERPDPQWEFYRDVLLPTPDEYREIVNRRTIDELAHRGAALNAPRRVRHEAAFSNSLDRATFIRCAESLGYRVVGQETLPSQRGRLPYRLHVEREECLDWQQMNAATAQLADLAARLGGIYSGWNGELPLAG